jgi:hypothetical protein
VDLRPEEAVVESHDTVRTVKAADDYMCPLAKWPVAKLGPAPADAITTEFYEGKWQPMVWGLWKSACVF